ncbi:hypothetical protein V1522DRAFT_447266 [Lipomyces starkeyi]
MCKHLVSYHSFPRPDSSGKYSVRPPPRCTPDLFQERLPLIRFDDFDLSGTGGVSPAEGSSNCVDYEPVVHSSNYLEKLESLQLLPSEDPEANEENDERSLELLRIMQWAAAYRVSLSKNATRSLLFYSKSGRVFRAIQVTLRGGPGQGKFSRQPNDEKGTEVVLFYATSEPWPAICLAGLVVLLVVCALYWSDGLFPFCCLAPGRFD